MNMPDKTPWIPQGKHRIIALFLSLTIWILLPAMVCIADTGHKIIIILSNNFVPYRSAMAGIEASFAGSKDPVKMFRENLSDSSLNSIDQSIKRIQPDIIITIGTKATLAILEGSMDIPVIFSMVLAPPEKLFRDSRATGILLDIPVEEQLLWLKKMCPAADRVGILYSRADDTWVKRAMSISSRLGLEIVPLRLDSPSRLPDMLDTLEQKADALWAVPDGSIYNTVISPQIILFCLRHKIPFMGLSSNFTRAGALLSLDCDYRKIGEQTAALAMDVLSGRNPSQIRPGYPARIIPALNMHTARILGLKIPENILKHAKIFAD